MQQTRQMAAKWFPRMRDDSPSSSSPTSGRSAAALQRLRWPFRKSQSTAVPAKSIPQLFVRQPSIDESELIAEPVHVEESSSGVETSIAEELPTATNGSAESKRSITNRFPLKKLRPKLLSSTSGSSADGTLVWRSMDGLQWKSAEGYELQLGSTRLENLSELERSGLQSLALQRLKKALGHTVVFPRTGLAVKQKRQKYIRKKAHTVNIMEKKQEGSGQQVFGISLSECIENDNRQASSDRCQSLDLIEKPRNPLQTQKTFSYSSKSSLSDQLSVDSAPTERRGSSRASVPEAPDCDPPVPRPYNSSDNLLQPTSSSRQSSPSRQSLSPAPVSSSPSPNTLHKDSDPFCFQDYTEPRNPQVPKIVETCTDYLKKRGLSMVGLFRVAGSAKRCRQMRVELNSGQEVLFTDQDDRQPHDIATLLKEYFRDLPDPLLTNDLYPSFLAVARLPEEDHVEVLGLLVALLPGPNCDTLLVLLKFLQDVANHSEDMFDEDGQQISGNKMTARNLATIFAPSILRSASSLFKPQQNLVDSDTVISIVEEMINNADEIFTRYNTQEADNTQLSALISPALHQDTLQSLQETEPEAVDHILNRLRLGSSSDREFDGADDYAPMSTISYTSHTDCYPQEIIREADGSTTVRVKEISTHRIVYKVHSNSQDTRPTISLQRSVLSEEASGELMEEKFSNLKFYIDDELSGTDQDSNL